MVDVAPGIERIESVFGPRPFAQYLLRGGGRSMLVDTGIDSTPGDVILPYFAEAGLDPAELSYVFTSHADVDHFGGNGAMRAAAPNAIFCASAVDAPIIGNRTRAMAERYGWYAEHGVGADYDPETKQLLASGMGPDTTIDLELTGGEWFHFGQDLAVQVLSLPGHSAGHLGLWEPVSRSAIVIDAVLGRGLNNLDREIIHPPPYLDAAAYEGTIEQLRSLRPERLLTAHYHVMEGDEAGAFLDASATFVVAARAAVQDAVRNQASVTLAGLVTDLGPALGPFSSFPNELAGPIRSHLRELAEDGLVEAVPESSPPLWIWIG